MRKDFSRFYGNLPLHPQFKKRKMLNRQSIAERYSLSVADIFKAYQCWINIFRYEESSLTFEQYLNKLKKANLMPSDVGVGAGRYNLSRYNDSGGYTDKSCRFILQRDNLAEQKKLFKPIGVTAAQARHLLKSRSQRATSRELGISRRLLRRLVPELANENYTGV